MGASSNENGLMESICTAKIALSLRPISKIGVEAMNAKGSKP
jgi:hypothetical protein